MFESISLAAANKCRNSSSLLGAWVCTMPKLKFISTGSRLRHCVQFCAFCLPIFDTARVITCHTFFNFSVSGARVQFVFKFLDGWKCSTLCGSFACTRHDFKFLAAVSKFGARARGMVSTRLTYFSVGLIFFELFAHEIYVDS